MEVGRVFWARNLSRGISGARKTCWLLRRDGIFVAHCIVERLMRQRGLPGARRGKQRIIRAVKRATWQPDHVRRCFRADQPDELWVVDCTNVWP